LRFVLNGQLFSHRFTQMNADRFKYKETTEERELLKIED
jgi:hypothetical protein